MRKLILLALAMLVVSVIAGCAGHTPTVAMPGDDAGPIEWKEYYKDQFKAFGDKVQPPDGQASLEQKVAYDDARSSYKKAKAIGTGVFVVLLVFASLLLIGTLNQASQL